MVHRVGVNVGRLKVIEPVKGLIRLESACAGVGVRGVDFASSGADAEVSDEHGEGLCVLLEGEERGGAPAGVGQLAAVEGSETVEGDIWEYVLRVTRGVGRSVGACGDVAAHVGVRVGMVLRGDGSKRARHLGRLAI